MDAEKTVVRIEADASRYVAAVEAAEKAMRAIAAKKVKVSVTPTVRSARNRHRKVGRNEACPCGSGKKFKRCHLLLGLYLVPVGD